MYAFFAQFYGTDIEQTEAAGGETLLLAVGGAKKVIAISEDFLAGYDPPTIRENLAAWNVAHLSRTLERGCSLSITADGPEELRD